MEASYHIKFTNIHTELQLKQHHYATRKKPRKITTKLNRKKSQKIPDNLENSTWNKKHLVSSEIEGTNFKSYPCFSHSPELDNSTPKRVEDIIDREDSPPPKNQKKIGQEVILIN